MKRREFFSKITAVGVASTVFPYINSNSYRLFAGTSRRYSAKAVSLVEETDVIDMLGSFHDDITTRKGKPLNETWLEQPAAFTAEDYKYVRSSGIKIFAFGDMIPEYDKMIEYLAQWNGFIASNSRFVERIDTPQKLNAIKTNDKIGIILSFQNSSHFRTEKDVGLFRGLGQVISQLTYNGANRLGYGAFEDNDPGLTDFGAAIIREMNRLNMGVDVSHCGDRTTLDAFDVSRKPVIITHAACRGLNSGYPRAKTDEAIKKMAESGGVIGIPMLRFMVRDSEPVSIEHFLDQIDYASRLVGSEHVGIGSDMSLLTEDAYPLEERKKRLLTAPKKYKCHTDKRFLISIDGLNHPKRTFDIAEGLIRRNYSNETIKNILGHNFRRVLKTII